VSTTGLVIAKAAGARTVITSSSDEKLKHVQEKYGVDYTINYKKTPNWAAEVQRLTGNLGADHIIENGGAGTIKQSLEAVAYGGVISVIGFLAGCPQEQMPDVAALALSKGAVVRGIIVGSKQQLESVTKLFVTKNLPLPAEREFSFTRDSVIAAYDHMLSGQGTGKVCIKLE
jgi:NADPH:quinone reductase-like Zn-dependent oxidoreductase